MTAQLAKTKLAELQRQRAQIDHTITEQQSLALILDAQIKALEPLAVEGPSDPPVDNTLETLGVPH